ncbi:rapamycin-insensitive companion of mTOR isoform X2 [Hydra vulgaris]|uniref:Rapamycin-insensitive companion of mTOR isoform X2 n=1 Tax=Hydra vulgaris TaxID=6087 RepID=A0ABM4BIA5_HYDVU
MKKFKRRSVNSFQFAQKSDPQNAEEAPPLDLSRDVAENMKYLLTEITRKDHMTTSRRMGFLNNFSQFVRCVPSTSNFGFTFDQISACLRVALISPAMQVRAACFRAFRHLLIDAESLKIFLQQRLDIFIIRTLDTLAKKDDSERVQALRLIRKIVYLCPESFPISLGMSLAAICCDMSTEKDHMSRPCLATLCELAVSNIAVASYCGVVHAVILNTLDCTFPRMNEALISTVLFLLNHPHYRCYVRKNYGLEAVLAPFTDIYYRYNAEIPENLLKDDQINRMGSASLALIAIIKSWSGFIYICNPECNTIETLFGVFRLPHTEIRKVMIDMFFEIFCLCKPVWTNHFTEALLSVDPSSPQDSWSLTEDFVVAEAEVILPHLAKQKRVNMIESYLSLMLHTFFDAGILDSLVSVVTTSDDYICIRGCILLGELLYMANILMPPSFSSHSNCLPSLMAALAANNEKSPEERGKASAAVGYLHQLHQMKMQKPQCNSLFMREIVAQFKNNTKTKTLEYQISSRDTDDVLTAIRDTQVTTLPEEEFEQWNWDLISALLDSSKMTIKKPDEPLYLRFIRKLLMFYKPDKKLYCMIKQDPENQKYTDVALQLTDFLMQPSEQPEGEKLMLEFLQDITESLAEAVHPGIVNGIFGKSSLTDTLSSGYILIIGRFTSTMNGWITLNKTQSLIPHLFEICSMHSREYLIKLVISSLNYQDTISKIILTKVLIGRSTSSRLFATKFMRVLLSAGTSADFNNWGIERLSFQLYDYDPEVVEAAFSVLEEVCENTANLRKLVEIKPCLMHLGGQGVRLFSRYVSEVIGFEYLKEKNYLDTMVRSWVTEYTREYVNWIEIEIAKSLSTFEPQSQDGLYIRRSNSSTKKKKDVYMLPHLYGELAVNEFGVDLIIKQNLLTDAVNVVVQALTDTLSNVIQLKAALWSIGHISSRWSGMNLILKYQRSSSIGSYEANENLVDLKNEDNHMKNERHEDDQIDIVELVVNMAQNSPVLTVRGTCFFVLGLMASTNLGAGKLEDLGWSSVRHQGTDIWPVIEPEYTYIMEQEFFDDDKEKEINCEEADVHEESETALTSSVYMGEEVINDDCFGAIEITYEKFGKNKKKNKGYNETDVEEKKKKKKGENKKGGDVKMFARHYDLSENNELQEKHYSNTVDTLSTINLSSGLPIETFTNADKVSNPSSNKPVFSSFGIYLGDDDTLDDSIEANVSYNSQMYLHEKVRISENGEQLLPIKEEKSQELPTQEKFRLILSNEESLILDQKVKDEKVKDEKVKEKKVKTLPDPDSSLNSEDRTPTQSPCMTQTQNGNDVGRYRSISLNDRSTMSRAQSSFRSSSFSDSVGNSIHSYKNDRLRTGSDPGVVQNTYVNDFYNQNKNSLKDINENGRTNAKVNRDKSSFATEDDQDRSSSFLSDSSTNDMQLRTSRLRDGSVISLGTKGTRGLSSTFSESPISITYTRDLDNLAYTAWRTLKKQRSFKRDIDFAYRKNNNFPDKWRYSSRSLALQYRRNLDLSKHRRSVGQLALFTRRQISFSTSSNENQSNDRSKIRYVGRCLPMNISDFFKIESYNYEGSWPEHFYEFSAKHNIHTFDQQHYKHVIDRCLACSLSGKYFRSCLHESVEIMTSQKNDDEQLKDSSIVHSNVRDEILKQILNLSSGVSSKVAQQELISLRSKHPLAFQNLCLYSQVMEHLGMFTYRLSIRRFVHALFEGVDFALVIETADHILGRTN